MNKNIKNLLALLDKSPSVFHAVDNIKTELVKEGFTELCEYDNWDIKDGGAYFVVRNSSSIIAFRAVANCTGFNIVASHSDSPAFKLKENPEIATDTYVTLNTERYGGMIMSTWMDKPLSVAGRVIVKQGNEYTERLVDIDKDLLIIPSVAIHMDREVNDGKKYNAQVDMLPIIGGGDCKGALAELVAKTAGVTTDEIQGSDLFLYSRQKSALVGINDEYLSAAHLDDLQCAYTSMLGFIDAVPTSAMPVLAVFDNEEVGSSTKQGAASTFLGDVLAKVVCATGGDTQQYKNLLGNSFMISADNAHAVHPNHGHYADPVNKPKINKGIVVKHSASQSYTTDGISNAVFKGIVESAGCEHQTFTNRSDVRGGATLGNISATRVSINTVDVGLPQLAMHSAYETAGVKDSEDFISICKKFYETKITRKNGGYVVE